MTGRRIVCIRMDAILVKDTLRGEFFPDAVCIEHCLPEEAMLVGAEYNLMHDTLDTYWTHESFDIVEDGESIPHLAPLYSLVAP